MIFCFLTLAANAYLLYSLHAKTDRILWEAHQIQNDVNNQLNSMYTQISRQKEQITELKEYVEKSQSLFHETRADMKFRDGKLYVTAEAIPKSQSEGQQVIAGIQAGDRVYEAFLDDDGRAVLEVDVSSSLQPYFKIINGDETVTEYTDKITPAAQMEVSISSEWDGTDQLQIILDSQAEEAAGSSFGEGTFILVKTGEIHPEPGTGYGGGSFRASASLEGEAPDLPEEVPEGIRIPANRVSQGDFAIYQGDFSEYAQKKDGSQYQVYFTVETDGGLTYLTYPNPAVEFSFYEGGTSRSTSGSRMYPVFDLQKD